MRKHFEPHYAVELEIPSHLSAEEQNKFKEAQTDIYRMFGSGFDFAKMIMEGLIKKADQYAEIISKRQWIVVPYPSNYDLLVTTDLPFVATKDFASSDSIHIFPVTPSLALLVHESAEYICEILKANLRQGFAYINFALVSQATEVYYKNKGHQRFIERFLGCLSEPVQNDEDKKRAYEKVKEFVQFIPEYVNDLGVAL
jgi:hypothetical protein